MSTKNRAWVAALTAAFAMAVGLAVVSATEKPGDALNDKCPVEGKAVKADCTSDVTIKFCCNNCKGKCEKDPGAYLGKIDKLPNEKCPVAGKDVKDASATVTVAFCCDDCKKEFDKDPTKCLGKVKAKKKDGK